MIVNFQNAMIANTSDYATMAEQNKPYMAKQRTAMYK